MVFKFTPEIDVQATLKVKVEINTRFVNYAMSQFTKRFERLEKARGASLDEINRVARETEDA